AASRRKPLIQREKRRAATENRQHGAHRLRTARQTKRRHAAGPETCRTQSVGDFERLRAKRAIAEPIVAADDSLGIGMGDGSSGKDVLDATVFVGEAGRTPA